MRIGVDLGGTKIEVVALSDDGSELIRRRIPTPARDYAATLDAIAGLVNDTEAALGRRGSVGIGTPGAIDAVSGMLKNSNSAVLNGKPLHRDLESVLDRRIRIANDANCLALSEATDGAATGARVMFAAILGTGVGGAVAFDGNVVAGRNNIAGEWGHNQLPWMHDDEMPGPGCYCGKRGCIETFLCGPALQREPDITVYEDRLARALAAIVNVLDPDVIVLGGGVSKVDRLYGNVPRLMERYVFSTSVDIAVVPAKHGDSSGVRGAAMLWPSKALR